MKNRVINLIAVRLKSTRLKEKAMLDLCGKPLIWHVADRVKRARIPIKTILCTSDLSLDDPIAEFARENDLDCFRGHPEDVMERFLQAAEIENADHIVRITGDNPLTDPEIIDEMIKVHIEGHADYTFTQDPPRGTRPEIISVAAMKKCHALAEDPNFSEYMTYYFKDYPEVFKNLKYDCVREKVHHPEYLLTVDTQEDYLVIKKIYETLFYHHKNFSLGEVIDFLEEHQEISHTNRKKAAIDSNEINTRLSIG